jgi:hypothetical protein
VSQIADRRAAIVAALAALPALAGVQVKVAVVMDDVWSLQLDRKPTVFVVYSGFRRQGEQLAGNHGAQSQGPSTWNLISVVNDMTDGTTALTKTLGADELCERVRGIRGVNIAAAGPSPFYLTLVSEVVVEGPERTPRGGQLAYHSVYESSYHRL